MEIKITVPDDRIQAVCASMGYANKKKPGEAQKAFLVRIMREYLRSHYKSRKRKIDRENQSNRLPDIETEANTITSEEVVV